MTNLCVVGQGKLGFPVAVYYAAKGAVVRGLDVDADLVDRINSGDNPVPAEPEVGERLAGLLASGGYRATTDPEEALTGADVVIVLVPLLAHGGVVDFGNIDAAVKTIAAHATSDMTVIFETTLPVGATRDRFAAVLSQAAPGVSVVHSPERVSSNRIWRDLDTYPKLVGGVDAAAAEKAASFYRRYLPAEVRVLGAAETAEMAKLAETTYRDLNIAFANELARFSDEWGVDVSEVIDAANSQPYSHVHRPGVGVGGHCIPHYPYLLLDSTSGSDLVRQGRSVNEAMPGWVVGRIEREIGSLAGRRVHLLGVAYRGGVKETASSPAFPLARELRSKGAIVTAEDPLYSDEEVRQLEIEPGDRNAADVLLLVTDHLEYRTLDWRPGKAELIVDGRNVIDRSTVERAGVRYLGIGR